jgi:hypothetical protein
MRAATARAARGVVCCRKPLRRAQPVTSARRKNPAGARRCRGCGATGAGTFNLSRSPAPHTPAQRASSWGRGTYRGCGKGRRGLGLRWSRCPYDTPRRLGGPCVRDSRPQGRDSPAGRSVGTCTRALQPACGRSRRGGPAQSDTVVSCPTAREARPGAKRRDTPPQHRNTWWGGLRKGAGRWASPVLISATLSRAHKLANIWLRPWRICHTPTYNSSDTPV